jgi:hypothetical protein
VRDSPSPGWIVQIHLRRWKIEETFRFIKQSYHGEDIRVLRYQRLKSPVWLVTAAAYFATTILGQKLKLKILCEKLLIISRRFFGIPPFRFDALADGIKQILAGCRPSPRVELPPDLQLELVRVGSRKKRRKVLWNCLEPGTQRANACCPADVGINLPKEILRSSRRVGLRKDAAETCSSGCSEISIRLNEMTSGKWLLAGSGLVFFTASLLCPLFLRGKSQSEEAIDDISGTYDFLTADDTLSILDQEGRLDGSLDVAQSDEESDAILSYEVKGTHKKNRVEFQTNKIHQKSYRFRGTVQRGTGLEEKDPDYIQLVGDLEIVTTKGDSGQESVQRMHMIFKSKGRTAAEQE